MQRSVHLKSSASYSRESPSARSICSENSDGKWQNVMTNNTADTWSGEQRRSFVVTFPYNGLTGYRIEEIAEIGIGRRGSCCCRSTLPR